MDISNIIRKVKKIEITSKLLSNQQFAGVYHTAFKGKGMEFSEVREYTYGDDIRHIDWNVSARMKSPYVKLFHEEREQTVMFMVDISQSVLTSIGKTDRRERIAEIVATLAFSANRSQDNIGLLLFDSEIKKYLPPKKGYQQILQIIRAIMIADSSVNNTTHFETAVNYFCKVQKRNSIVFLLSDFLFDNYKNALSILSAKNDVIGVSVKDPLDDRLPDIGLVQIQDAENNLVQWVDTSSESYRAWYQQQAQYRNSYFKKVFLEANADIIMLSDQEDYIKKLQLFFHQRIKKN
ncbi:MAG: DUF58 domain-containing protein [Chitinophagales bacterium]|nr:DUF58 domain-containing protein [Chitinophagales bacterium]MCZ2392689.1 DUF58 domain-containing protein [Chitinophagales bacterium]